MNLLGPAKEPAYQYNIKEIVKYIDGDTVDVVVDLGFRVSVKKRIRLYGINTPEIRLQRKIKDLKERQAEKERGLKARERLVELCEANNGTLILRSHGLGKYGRVLGEIFNDNCSVNRMLVIEGHAEEYNG
jgi:micrococcal nuclease